VIKRPFALLTSAAIGLGESPTYVPDRPAPPSYNNPGIPDFQDGSLDNVWINALWVMTAIDMFWEGEKRCDLAPTDNTHTTLASGPHDQVS
jgi:hypothetical protein